MSVEFGSSRQLADLERKLSQLGQQGLDKALEAAVLKALEPLPDAVERSALAILPKRGGLNKLTAAKVVPKQERGRGAVKVFAVGRDKMRHLVALDRGLVRHPVFGRDKWVNQPVAPKFWARPALQREDAVKAAARAAIDKIVDSF